MTKLITVASGAFFLLYGLVFALFPTEMSWLVTSASPQSSSGLIDLRATYGGMSIAVGLTILILGQKQIHQSLALLVTAIVLFSMAATRILGIVVDRDPNWIMWLYLAGELIVAAAALYCRHALPMDRNNHS